MMSGDSGRSLLQLVKDSLTCLFQTRGENLSLLRSGAMTQSEPGDSPLATLPPPPPNTHYSCPE